MDFPASSELNSATAPPSRDLSEAVVEKLRHRDLTLSVAESCTGGLIGGTLTRVPGVSHCFRGGIIAYDNGIKRALLKVPAALLTRHGAVSAPVVAAMAKGARKLFATSFALAISGIAGPQGGSPEKPVGLVYIACCAHDRCETARHIFHGDRDAIRQQSVQAALGLLEKRL